MREEKGEVNNALRLILLLSLSSSPFCYSFQSHLFSLRTPYRSFFYSLAFSFPSYTTFPFPSLSDYKPCLCPSLCLSSSYLLFINLSNYVSRLTTCPSIHLRVKVPIFLVLGLNLSVRLSTSHPPSSSFPSGSSSLRDRTLFWMNGGVIGDSKPYQETDKFNVTKRGFLFRVYFWRNQ